MELKIGGQYSLLLIHNEKIHCEIRSGTSVTNIIVFVALKLF